MNKSTWLILLVALVGATLWGYFTLMPSGEEIGPPVSEGELVDAGHFVLTSSGATILDEQYTLYFHPVDGYLLMSDGELRAQGQTIQLAQQAQYDRDFMPFFYHLAAETPTATQIISAQMGMTGLTMEVRVGLARQSSEIVDASNVALLDNNLISHFVILLDAIRSETLDRRFTAAIPQALLGLPSKLEGPNAATLVSDGMSYDAKQFDLYLGDLLIELYEVDGRLAGLFNDAQATVGYDLDRFPGGIERGADVETAVESQAFTERELGFSSDGVELSGTLALPSGSGPFAAAILVAGSGPVDRDGNAQGMPMDAYRQLAHALAEAGIASYRYDKRGVGESGGAASLASRDDLVADLAQALDAVKQQAEIDASRVFIIGHSEGAYLAPAVAIENPDLAGIVLLSGAARPLDEITDWQVQTLLELQGATDEQIAVALEQQAEYYAFVETSEGEWSDYTVEDVKAEISWANDAMAQQLLATPLSLSWLRQHYLDEPAETLVQVTVPVLAIGGGKDVQVPAEEANRIQTVLTDAGNTDVQGMVLEDLNHLLRYHPEQPNLVFRHLDEPIDPRVADTILQWMLARAGE